MIIRQASSTDVNSVQSLLAQLGYPDLSDEMVSKKIEFHKHAGYHMLLGEVDQQVVGFLSMHWFELLHWKGPLGRFTSFCMDEKFRSQGYGQKLLHAGEDFLIKQGCLRLEVTSNIKRERTHEFYLKAGYIENSRRFVKLI